MYIATQDKPFFPTGLKEKFAAVKEMGFDAFEIDGRLLPGNPAWAIWITSPALPRKSRIPYNKTRTIIGILRG